ncbi:MAG: hypothetical protein ACOYXN_10230 [Acidobacteriota bacterium]
MGDYTAIRRTLILTFLLSGLASGAADPPLTAPQVVARCAAAMGGADRIAAVRTLRIQMTPAAKPRTVTHEIKRPDRIRSESADYILVFDGKRAGYLKGAPPEDGRDPGPKLLPEEEGRDFELDIAFLFPAFFDHPARYLGMESYEAKPHHKLAVTLPLGIRVIYWLDGTTFLPTRIVGEISIQGSVARVERTLQDYVPVEGLLFPRTMTSSGWAFTGRASVTKVEINIPLEDGRFEMPGEARGRIGQEGP